MNKPAIVTVAFCLSASVCVADNLPCAECVGGHSNLVPFDIQAPWAHGQHKRLPAYSGYASFRPYNYRHVAPQAQIAVRWGAMPGIPYSAGAFNRYYTNPGNSTSQSQTPKLFTPRPMTLPSTTRGLLPALPERPLRPVPNVPSGPPPIHVLPNTTR